MFASISNYEAAHAIHNINDTFKTFHVTECEVEELLDDNDLPDWVEDLLIGLQPCISDEDE